MSRSTQYIGLTKMAEDYVEKHAINKEVYHMWDGMFGEEVGGCIYEIPYKNKDKGTYKVMEVVQDTPWSSGMMIFTSLFPIWNAGNETEEDFISENKYDLSYRWFNWIVDPTLSEEHCELDYDRGTYWV